MSHSATVAKDRTPILLVPDVSVGHPDAFVGLPITPAEQVRLLLAYKKEQGIVDWERVWAWSVKRVRWPHDREERFAWKETIAWAESTFHAAYCDEPIFVDMSALEAITKVA